MQSREETSLGGTQIIIQVCQGGEKRKKENLREHSSPQGTNQ